MKPVETLVAAIESIQTGTPASVNSRALDDDGNSSEREWRTGFGKTPVAGPVQLRVLNLDGDGQADKKHHGGPDKAVCVYPHAHYPVWQRELMLDLKPGAFGENFTVGGLLETDVCIGDVWEIGAATVQVSQPRQPCWKLARWWNIKDLALRVQQTGRTGWYLRVLAEGAVEAGQPIKLVRQLHPDWTIEAANKLMHLDKDNLQGAERLSRIPELSDSWKQTLTRRIQKRTEASSNKRLFGLEPDPGVSKE